MSDEDNYAAGAARRAAEGWPAPEMPVHKPQPDLGVVSAPPIKTLEEKRAFARDHLASQAKEARDQEAYYLAVVKGRSTFAAYCDRRAATVEQIEEVELDLMIAQWRACIEQESARRGTYTEDAVHRVMFLRYDGVLGPKVIGVPAPVVARAAITADVEPPKETT